MGHRAHLNVLEREKRLPLSVYELRAVQSTASSAYQLHYAGYILSSDRSNKSFKSNCELPHFKTSSSFRGQNNSDTNRRRIVLPVYFYAICCPLRYVK